MHRIDMLKKATIVAAHPDDEVLWFSSILNKVDKFMICFLDHEFNSQWSIGRKKSLAKHPMKNFSNLGLTQADVFRDDNFRDPVITKYGIKMADKKIPDTKYIKNFYKLKNDLRTILKDYNNVFTHNPWGEYGHEEHIQIYRVVKELQKEMSFNLWFTNYCSNKSFGLMLKWLPFIGNYYVTLETNKELAHSIKDLYTNNACWTWYDDWEWPKDESFIMDKRFEKERELYGKIVPLNLISVDLPSNAVPLKKKRPNILSSIHSKIVKNNLKRLT